MLISEKKILSIFLIMTIIISITGINIIQVQAEEYNNLLYSIENDEITITGIKGLITEIEVPAEISGYPVTKIAAETFYQSDCHETLEKVVLPDTITYIGKYAFAKCEKLESIKVPQKVVELYDSTFSYCFSLKSLFIYNTLTDIGESVFDVCPLETIYYSGSKEEYNRISVARYNDGLNGANVIYNCNHMHEFINYVSDNNATCETNCTETAKCTLCDVTDTREIPNTALGHKWNDWVITKKATMTETGEKQRICKNNSSHIETESIPMLDIPFAGGSGTEEDPYQVSTPEQLDEVRNNLDKYFIQINDIDMSESTSEGGIYWNDGKGWTPIGDNSNAFSGLYNGQNYKISNLNCMDETTEYVGLFGYNNGILKNIVMDKCSVSNGKYTGMLVGKNGSTNSYTHYIENINVLNCTILGSDYTGAISGMNIGGSIKNIRINDCNISGTTNVGGVVGSHDRNQTSNGIIDNIRISGGSITGTDYVGGITGYNCATVENCNIKTNVNGGKNTGGIVGRGGRYIFIDSKIQNCFVDGDILGEMYVGGIIGSAYTTTINECMNSADICYLSSENAGVLGGISAYGSNFSIRKCTNAGNIQYSSNVKFAGGIIGYILAGGTVQTLENCYNSGSVFNSSDENIETGAIVGAACSPNYKMTFTIKNCYSSDSKYNNKICNGNVKNNIYLQDYMNIEYENCYLINSNNDTSPGVTLLSADEMKQKDKFVGFDFDTIWDISPNINDGMPYLRGVGNLQPTIRVGDVNGDNEIDFRDAQLIMQYEAGLISLTDEQKSAADINKDGEIDFFDAQLIMMYEAGLISSL